MATPLADALFWIAAVAILVSQALILRSTRRGMRHGPPGSDSPLEWAFALGPAVVLVAVLFWTHEVMHPEQVNFRVTPPAASGVRS
jgi:hypothetical protein